MPRRSGSPRTRATPRVTATLAAAAALASLAAPRPAPAGTCASIAAPRPDRGASIAAPRPDRASIATAPRPTPVAAPRVDRVRPQLSYSIAVGKSEGGLIGHLWAGAGARGRHGGFVLGGVEIDLRERAGDDAVARATTPPPSRSPGGNELWVAVRAGIGAFKPRALAPMASMYAIGGSRALGADGGPRHRLGLGASVPALLPLARLGVPTMIEAGVDTGARDVSRRWFLRAGWNF
jgi:hypothetical protein